MSVEELRQQLDALDARLIDLIAERQRLVTGIGRLKQQTGSGTRDYRREKVVIERAHANAERSGVPPALAEAVMRMLIESSLATQEEDYVRATARGEGRRALVIGGSGRMGAWFARFLDSQGFEVTVADPIAPAGGFEHVTDWRNLELNHDLIVVAAPLRRSNEVLLELAQCKPAGIVFDIGSLKSPLREGLDALRAAGCRVTSVHPLFGPGANLLSGRHVVFVDLGDRGATDEVRRLFASTMAVPVDMSLEQHDRLMGYVLGLSHALNIAVFSTLTNSGEAAPELARISSTTFDRQLAVASEVARENPRLYFEIQSLNAHGGHALRGLREAVDELLRCVEQGDETGFVAMMERGRGYLAARQAPR